MGTTEPSADHRRNPLTTAFTNLLPLNSLSRRILRPIPPQPVLSLSLNSPSESESESKRLKSESVSVSVSGLKSGKGGPAFIGQVYSMCDLSGTGLMAVSTHYEIPFISQKTPEWVKKIFATVGKSDKGPVFRFFMDLGDAVSYVRKLNIPSGIVGACRLDMAFEHFKGKPHLFQFVPNEKQVKEANKLLKTMPESGGKKEVDGVPVFSAQNLDIAIATTDGIKWYTPYFFDKKMLDDILEDSVDQHFKSIIRKRKHNRIKGVVDDRMDSEMAEAGESMWEPPEVEEVLDEIDLPENLEIPMSVYKKAAEIELLYTVDKMLLGNRWFRKATRIQPKFPYMVESFEKRSGLLEASERPISSGEADHYKHLQNNTPMELAADPRTSFQFPFGDWLKNPWLNQKQDPYNQSDKRVENISTPQVQSSPFLPKITMVGISSEDTSGELNKAKLKKTMDDLTEKLEQHDQENATGTACGYVERDPLFVSNVGDYYAGGSNVGTSRFVRWGVF